MAIDDEIDLAKGPTSCATTKDDYDRAMKAKRCVVTGANSGIGEVTARQLARMGARVTMICRSEDRARAAMDRILAEVPDAELELELADLSSLADVRRVAGAVCARHEQIDVLVNNAGIYLPKRHESAEGFEMTLATNHLGPFLLTRLLIANMPRGARVVTVASEAHRGGKIDFDDLQASHRFSGMRAYCTSKLMNILFAKELARRHEAVASNALHPGSVASGFAQDEKGVFQLMVKLLRPFLINADAGARTQIHLASSPDVEGVSGEYFIRSRPKRASARACDEDVAGRLWEVSAELTSIAP
jgi:NAD(P)-dependent dehydrogenase (short-subunit alcohol dehydrogenase family)